MACSYRQCCGESTLKRTTIHRRDFQYRQCFSELDRLVFSKLAQRIISSADIAILTVRHGFTVADEKEAGCGQEVSSLSERLHTALCMVRRPVLFRGIVVLQNPQHLY